MTVSKFPTWLDYLQVAPQPPWWWKFELNKPGWKLSIRVTLIAISHYLEAKFDYGYLIIFFVLWFQDSTQKISSHFDQKWGRDGNFSRILIWFDRPLLAQGQKLPIGQKWNPHSWNWQLKYISLDWCTYS